MKRIIFLFIFTAVSYINLYSANIFFDNDSGDNLWNTASNWSGNVIPGTSDLAVIGSQFIVTIPTGYTAKVEQVSLLGGSLNVLGTLSMFDRPLIQAIFLDIGSILEVSGNLTINNYSSGIAGDGSFIVPANGNVTFINTGAGTALDATNITIKAGGNLTIDQATNGIIFNGGLINSGTLNISDVSFHCIQSFDDGVTAPGSVTNHGTINMNNNSQGTFFNISYPLFNYGTVDLNNSAGNILLAIITGHDLINEGEFNVSAPLGSQFKLSTPSKKIINQECGTMNFDNVRIGSQSRNYNIFHTNAERFGAFINDGVVFYTGPFGLGLDDYGGYSTNSQSDGVVVTEESGLFEVGVASSDFWIDNSGATVIGELFTNQALTVSAGNIFLNNVWVPSAAAAGKQVFYAQPNVPNCTDIITYTLGGKVKSGDNIWNGIQGDDLWANPGNWSLGHIPTDSEYAIIPQGAKVVVSQVAAEALHVENSGTLTIANNNKLIINDSPIQGLTNEISGTLLIDGELIINNSNLAGLLSLATNGNSKNAGKIIISDVDASYAMDVKDFSNKATIIISNCEDGLRVGAGLLTNEGEILIDNVDFGLIPAGTFVNKPGSSVTVSNSEVGILHFGTLLNEGNITIDNTDDNGIRLLGDLHNLPLGTITIDQSDEFALLILSGNTFENEGKLVLKGIEEPNNITDNGSLGINDGATFDNKPCGIIEHEEYIEMNSTAIFINEGSIISLGEVVHSIVPSFVNNGTLVNNQDSWDNVFFVNNKYVVTPKIQSQQVGDLVFDIFSASSIPYPFSSFYIDEALTMPAGYYFPSLSAWKVTAMAIGKKRFYFAVNYDTCDGVAYFELPDPVDGVCETITWAGGQGDWSKASNWNLNRVPSACDDVKIPGTSQVFMDVMKQNINSLQLSSGELIIPTGKKLNIGGFYANGILVELGGTLTNNGTISFGLPNNGLSVNNQNTTFVNNGTVNGTSLNTMIVQLGTADIINNVSGIISVAQSNLAPQGGSGIHLVEDGCNFSNDGNIILTAFKTGLKMDDLATFDNNQLGEITIIESTDIAVILENESYFTNRGLVNLNANTDQGINISTDATFDNKSTATLSIEDNEDNAIYMFDSGVLDNDGTITINETTGQGIRNRSNITNSASGNITISGCTEESLYQDIPSSRFTNSGTTTINHSNAFDAIENNNSALIRVLSGTINVNN